MPYMKNTRDVESPTLEPIAIVGMGETDPNELLTCRILPPSLELLL